MNEAYNIPINPQNSSSFPETVHSNDKFLPPTSDSFRETSNQDVLNNKVVLDEKYQEPVKRESLGLLSADYILTNEWPEPNWAIPNFLPVGLSILAGAPKVGKSWLALQLSLAITSGGLFFDKQLNQGPILYLALEDSSSRLSQRMRAQGWTMGLEAEFMPMGNFEDQIGNIMNGGAQKLAKQIAHKKYRLVVIDTLSRAVPGKQKEVEDMTSALTPLQEIAHNTNCAVMLIDHHRKNGVNEPDAIADILGSTAKGAMADTAWGIYKERGKRGAKLAITGRDIEEQTLNIAFDSRNMSWKYEGNTDDLTLTERRQDILDALGNLGRAKVNDIAIAVGQERSNTHPRLQDLESAGKVRRIPEGGNIYYEIVN